MNQPAAAARGGSHHTKGAKWEDNHENAAKTFPLNNIKLQLGSKLTSSTTIMASKGLGDPLTARESSIQVRIRQDEAGTRWSSLTLLG